MRFPRGVFLVDSPIEIPAWFSQVSGEGVGQTVLVASHLSGPVIRVGARSVTISDLSITSVDERANKGSGPGIALEPVGEVGVSRFVVRDVLIDRQPSAGLDLVDPELCHLENVDSEYNRGVGLIIRSGKVTPWNGLLLNVRCRFNGQSGLQLLNSQIFTFLNLQLYANGGGAQGVVTGRGHIMINPNVEGQDNPASVGLVVSGSRHNVLGGHFSGLRAGFSFQQARYCKVIRPYLTNERYVNVDPMIAFEEDAASHDNVVELDEEDAALDLRRVQRRR